MVSFLKINSDYLIPVIVIVVMILYMWWKQQDVHHLKERFKNEKIIFKAHGTYFYGLQSEPGGLLRSSGQIFLFKDRIFYKGRFDNRELTIPKDKLMYIAITDNHKGLPLYWKSLAFYFEKDGKVERAAFMIPFSKQFVDALKTYFEKDGRKIPIKEELW